MLHDSRRFFLDKIFIEILRMFLCYVADVQTHVMRQARYMLGFYIVLAEFDVLIFVVPSGMKKWMW